MPVELDLSDDEIDSIFSSGEIQGFKDIRMADAINDVFPFPIDGSNAIDDFLRHLDVDPMLSNLNREISSNGTSPPQGYGLDGQSLRLNTPPFSPLAELDGPAFHDLNGSNSLDDMPIIFGNVAVNPSLDFAPPSANADSDISSSSLQEMSIGGGGNEKMINSPSPSYDQDIEVSMDGSDISGQSRARILVPASSGRIMVMVPQAVPKLNPLLQYLKHCGSANSKLMKHQQQKEEDFDSINRVDSSGQAYRWGECMTSAAVRARERRRENKHKLHDMEGTVQKLNTENQQLRLENAQMRREMDSLRNEVASLRSLIPLLEQFQQQGVSKRVQVVVHPVELQQNGAVLKRKQNLESECGHSKKKRRSTRCVQKQN